MRIVIIAALLACAAGAGAQDQAGAAPAAKSAAAAPAPAARKKAKAVPKSPAKAPAAQAAPAGPAQPKPRPAQPAAAKADQESDEAVVMIDSKADLDETGRFAAAEGDQEEGPAAQGGLPSSYGQLKGALNEGGRSLLVFENPDDGALTFVQVSAGRNGVAWKLVDRIPRSGD